MRGHPWGTDVFLDGDFQLSPSGDLVSCSGVACIGQDLRMRLQTPRGTLKGHPAYGLDIRMILHAEPDPEIFDAFGLEIVEQVERDDRIEKGTVGVSMEQVSLDRVEATVECQTAITREPVLFVVGWGAERHRQEVLNAVDN